MLLGCCQHTRIIYLLISLSGQNMDIKTSKSHLFALPEFYDLSGK